MPRTPFVRPTPPPRRRPGRLVVERLEDRLAPSVFIPVQTRRDLVFDDTRGVVFLTTSTGSIIEYDPAQQIVIGGLQVNSKGLNGIDITPDGSALYAGDAASNILWKIDLSKGVNNPIVLPLPVPGGPNSVGVWDVSIASNGTGFVTPTGTRPVSLVALSTGIDTLTPAGTVQANTNLFRGADRSAILILQGNGAQSPVQAAKLVNGSLVLTGSQTTQFNGNVAGAVSRNGAQYAVTVNGNQSVVTNAFTDVNVFNRLNGGDAFDPVRDVFYAIDSATDEVVAIDAANKVEKYRLPAGEDMSAFQGMGSGLTAVSPDGKQLFFTTPSGARMLDLPQPSNKLGILSITSPFPSVVSAGTPGTFTVQAKDAAGNVLPNYVGQVSLFSSDPNASFPQPTYTFTLADQGTHTFAATLNTPGSQSITASDLIAGKGAAQKGIAVGAANATRDLIPVTGQRDLVFDDARNQLVVTFADGSVGRFDVATQTLVTSPAGNGLAGADITADRQFVYIADRTAGLVTGYFRKVDLTTGAVTSIPFDLLTAGAGPTDVVIPTGVLALTAGGSGGLDVSTDKVVSGFGVGDLYRSADRTLVVMRSATDITRYDPATQKTATSFPGAAVSSVGVSRDGALVSVGMTAGNQPFLLSTIDAKNDVKENILGLDGGVIYDPLRDVLYAIDTAKAQIVVLDAVTFAEKYRIDLNHTAEAFQPLGPGVMAISGDGSRLFLSTSDGILQFVLGPHDGALKTLAVTSAFPSITTTGTAGTFTVQAKDAAGDVITNFTGTVTVTTNDPSASVPVKTYTFTAADQGTKTFDLTFNSAGSRTITVSGENNVSSTQTVTVNTYGLVPYLALPQRSDQLFDPTRNQTIITGSDGYLYRFDQDTQTLLPRWKVGTYLFGADMTADGNFLYVADRYRGFAQGFFRKVDLNTGAVTNLPYAAGGTSGIGGAYDVARTPTGVMYATARGDTAGVLTPIPSFQIDLKTDAVGLGPFGKRTPSSTLQRSADGSQVLILEPDTAGTLTLFDTVTKGSFTISSKTTPLATHVALSADGLHVATGDFPVTVYDKQLKPLVAVFAQGGVQFDPTDPTRLIVADALASEIQVYDATTGQQISKVSIGEVLGAPAPFFVGTSSVSSDGRYFSVNTAEGVRRFDVTGQPGRFAVSGLSGTVTAGAPVTVTIAAIDPNTGAVLTGFTGLVRLANTDPNSTYPAEFTLTAADKGQTQVTITFRTAGAQTLTVASPSASLATGTATTRVLAGALAKFGITGLPANPSADVAYQTTVTAEDVFGNRITVEKDAQGALTAGYFGTVTFGSSDNAAVLPNDYQFTETDNGAHTFPITFRTLGEQTLTALDVVDSAVQGTVTVTVGPAPVVPPPPPPVIPPVVPPVPPVVPPVVPPPPGPPPVAPPLSGPGSTTAIGTGEGVLNQAWTVTAAGAVQGKFQPFEPGFIGGVRVAVARGPGFEHVVAVPGPGRYPGAVIADAATGTILSAYQAFESSFTGGMFVSAGDFLREGYDAYIFSPDEGGGPRVQIISGRTGQVIADFFGIDDINFRGGCRTGVADVNGDGTPDLIVAAGFGGGPRVAVFDGMTIRPGGLPRRLLADFFVFEPTLRNGVYVAGGDVNGDGFGDLAVGAGPGGAPRTVVLSGVSQLQNAIRPIADFFAGDVTNRGGVRVAVKDIDGDGLADLVTGSGFGGGSRVTVYPGKTLPTSFPAPPILREFDAIPGATVGVYVG